MVGLTTIEPWRQDPEYALRCSMRSGHADDDDEDEDVKEPAHKQQASSTASKSAPNKSVISCPRCTFGNPLTNTHCDMCLTSLLTIHVGPAPAYPRKPPPFRLCSACNQTLPSSSFPNSSTHAANSNSTR